MIRQLNYLAWLPLLLALTACSTPGTGPGAADPAAAGTVVIREEQVLRLAADGGVGQGTLRFQGWQYPFEVRHMIIGNISSGTIEIEGDVYNLQASADLAGTYQLSQVEVSPGKGLSGLWLENEKGVKVHIRSVGENDVSIDVHSTGSIVTMK